ncbi:unnamed protein product [Arabis nemorensis]|uniref:Uncharacterized protein n=1 Tax=Arabis nemorensis TaxID=586526 RepID=A0A565BB09_9BRAS|nr:unnamed protein product [Arabis nemorensis]
MKSCSLDLCLSPMTSTLQSCRRDSTVLSVRSSTIRSSEEANEFYNGRLREYDLVEIQNLILMMSEKHT